MKKIIILALLFQTHLSVYAISSVSSAIFADINSYRAKYNLPAIEQNNVLCRLAETRADQIHTDWSHDQFQGEIDRISGMGGVFYENLARTFEAKDVVWGWSMSQMGHREAMLVPTMKYGCVAESGDHYAFEGYIPN